MTKKKVQVDKIGRFYKLDAKLIKRFDKYCQDSGMRKDKAIEKALEFYLNENK